MKWFIEDRVDGREIGFRAIVDGEGFTVCEPSPMGEANAALIAAAPDLLEILEQCAKRGWMWDNDPSLYDATMKVIRKAKGQA